MKIKVKIVHSKELDPGLRREDERINKQVPYTLHHPEQTTVILNPPRHPELASGSSFG